MEKFLLVANWKSNTGKLEAMDFESKIEVAIAPPYPLISTIPGQFSRASQDVSAFPPGAYTGEVSAQLLASLGVKYVLVGHSEARKYLSETNAQVEAKLDQAVKAGIIPILCAQTIDEIPENIRNYPAHNFMVMYEPFSAISTDGQYHPETPEKVVATLADWQNKLNLKCRFLYGGSVNPENCKLLIENCKLVSGFVIGHASLNAADFSAIIKKCLFKL